jgi:hypothetical protein
MVVAAITTLVMGAVFVSFLTGGKAFVSSEAYVYVQQQARQAIEQMVRELRQADGGSVVVSGGQDECTFKVMLGYGLGGLCPLDNVCLGAFDALGVPKKDWRVQYRLAGGVLIREVLNDLGGVEETRNVAHDVNQLTFTHVAGATNSVTMALKIEQASSQLPGGKMPSGPLPILTVAKLRND